MSKLLFKDGDDWNWDIISNSVQACSLIAKELKLNTYRNQIEMIESDQMLDCYASVGLPIMYKHWSFGKRYSQERDLYRQGKRGLAYEIVINSDPCISYLMADNNAAMQLLVIAHAAFGHNHFFKNNYLFKQWTDASSIVDYLIFAKSYISKCEEKYGEDSVEKVLDSAHALMMNGVDRAKRPQKLSLVQEQQRLQERQEYLEKQVNVLWSTLPRVKREEKEVEDIFPKNPQENILYFLEKNSPILDPWQREILRIVRKISQYFYPQYQTKVMNEGWASFTHYYIMNRLEEEGYIDHGTMLEFLKSHTGVLYQPEYDSKYYSGINPYYFGFEMFSEIRRICTNPTDEDKEWFPNLIGKNWLDECLYAVSNFRDESFIRQYLSPNLIRKMRLFLIQNDTEKAYVEVKDIHDSLGYKEIRNALASSYEIDDWCPSVVIHRANIKTNREMTLRYREVNGRKLKDSWKQTAFHVQRLWGHAVNMETDGGEFLGSIQP